MLSNTIYERLRGFLLGIPRNFDAVEAVTTAAFTTTNEIMWTRLKEGGKLSSLRMFITISSGNLCVAVARNSGTGINAVPAALLATSSSVASPGTGSRTIALDSTVYARAGDWVGIAVDNTTISIRCRTTATPLDTTLAAGFSYREPISAGGPEISGSRGTLTACVGRNFVMIGI